MVARYVKWKGVEFVIRAFKQVLDQYPDALLILAGTHIERSLVLEKIKAACKDDIVAPQYNDVLSIFDCLADLPDKSYIEIPFEDDLYSLFKLFDIFVHTPIDSIQETFGQVYVEAMLSKVPSVITLSGSALDHARHQDNAWIVTYQNSDQIAEGILALLSDHDLRERMIRNAFSCATENYDILTQIRAMEKFYVSALESCSSS